MYLKDTPQFAITNNYIDSDNILMIISMHKSFSFIRSLYTSDNVVKRFLVCD